MIKLICLLCMVAALGCSTMTYERKTEYESVRLIHTTIGMEYKDVDLSAERSATEFKAKVKIGSASGGESLDRAITGWEETLNTLKALRP